MQSVRDSVHDGLSLEVEKHADVETSFNYFLSGARIVRGKNATMMWTALAWSNMQVPICMVRHVTNMWSNLIDSRPFFVKLLENKLSKLERHASRVHFAKIHFG